MVSSVPGGDASAVTDPILVLICMCGHPVLPGRLRISIGAVERASFQQSFDAAVKWRESVRPEAVVQQLCSKGFATKQEYATLVERIANLEAIVSQLPPTSTPSSTAPLGGQEAGE